MNAKIYTRNKLRLPKNLAKFHNQKILKLIVVLTIANYGKAMQKYGKINSN